MSNLSQIEIDICEKFDGEDRKEIMTDLIHYKIEVIKQVMSEVKFMMGDLRSSSVTLIVQNKIVNRK